MREVDTAVITEEISKLCIEANHYLAPDMRKAFDEAERKETNPLAKEILGQLQENLKIAGEEMIPICQDTGMAVIFLNVGQEVHFTGGDLTEAINKGVAKGYTEGYLRKSVVEDPLRRENTRDNAPAIIHTSIVPGDKVRLETKIIKQKGPMGIGEAVASVDGKVVVSAELTFVVGA